MEQIFITVFIIFIVVMLIGLCMFVYIKLNSSTNQGTYGSVNQSPVYLNTNLGNINSSALANQTNTSIPSTKISTTTPLNQPNVTRTSTNLSASNTYLAESQNIIQMKPIPIQRPTNK